SAPVAFVSDSRGAHPELHSFPTRRSSDFSRRGRGPGMGGAAQGRTGRLQCVWHAAHRSSSGSMSRERTKPPDGGGASAAIGGGRSEEHTSELQSRENLVCRPPPAKKKPAG